MTEVVELNPREARRAKLRAVAAMANELPKIKDNPDIQVVVIGDRLIVKRLSRRTTTR